MAKDKEKQFQRREKRILDAIGLVEPDRVPIVPLFAFFNCYYSGISPRVAYEHPEKAVEAWRKTIFDFQPDATYSVNFTIYAMDEVLSGLDFKAMKWPGHGVRDDQSFQFVEAEYMQEDEYAQLFANPGDFFLRKLLPRLAGNLKGLAKLPPLETAALAYVWPSVLPGFCDLCCDVIRHKAIWSWPNCFARKYSRCSRIVWRPKTCCLLSAKRRTPP